jgi:hypothetical protein
MSEILDLIRKNITIMDYINISEPLFQQAVTRYDITPINNASYPCILCYSHCCRTDYQTYGKYRGF